jgi:outer membrane receptor protein involved in Fe transport
MNDSRATVSASTHSIHRSRLSLSVALALATMGSAALAQNAPAPAVAASAPAGAASQPAAAKEDAQQVVVSATRRREPAREVPIQLDVLKAEQLETEGDKTLSDYIANLPGVTIKTDGGAGKGAVSVRGVSTGDQTVATVSTYIDDVAFGSSSAYLLGSTTALEMALLDLNHIELLRGPQGTLYGASSMGGLLKYVTNDPDTGELSGKVSVGAAYTQNGSWSNTVNGVINVPLKEDVAALRVAAFHEHAGGFVDAVGPAAQKDVNSGDTNGGRVALLIEPSSKFHIKLSATAQDLKRDGQELVDYDIATGKPVTGPYEHTLYGAEPYSVKTNVSAADLEYDFGAARLNSITSVQNTKVEENFDYTSVFEPILGPILGISTVPDHQDATVHKVTQEFRLTSKSGETFEWLAGLFYDKEEGNDNQLVQGTMPPGPPLLLGEARQPSHYEELAAYGDLTWNATDRLQLTGGARFAKNKQSYAQISDGILFPTTNTPGSSEDNSTTWLGTARYSLDAVSNVYFRAASGYRPGGPNAVPPVTNPPPPVIPPSQFAHDSLWSYEGGYKADLLDKTLSIETALYDIEWKDIQQFYAVSGVSVIVNGGQARVKGLEFASTWHATKNLNVLGSFAWNDARLTTNSPGLAPAGSRLPNSAPFSANLGVNGTFELAGHSAWAGLSERYEGERNAGFDGSTTLPNYKMPSYWMTDASAKVDFSRVSLGVYVRNVFNQNAQLAASTTFASLGGPVEVTPAAPRTMGVQLTANF